VIRVRVHFTIPPVAGVCFETHEIVPGPKRGHFDKVRYVIASGDAFHGISLNTLTPFATSQAVVFCSF
jgi:hypothetical protein